MRPLRRSICSTKNELHFRRWKINVWEMWPIKKGENNTRQQYKWKTNYHTPGKAKRDAKIYWTNEHWTAYLLYPLWVFECHCKTIKTTSIADSTLQTVNNIQKKSGTSFISSVDEGIKPYRLYSENRIERKVDWIHFIRHTHTHTLNMLNNPNWRWIVPCISCLMPIERKP